MDSEKESKNSQTRRMTAYPKPVFTQSVESEKQVTLFFEGFSTPCYRCSTALPAMPRL